MKRLIHIYCGDGKGKTTACIGLTVRAAGADLKVVFTQFLKDNKSSEIRIIKDMPNVEFVPCKQSFGFFWNMTDEEKKEAREVYNELLKEVIEKSKKADMLVMDEIIATYNNNLIDREMFLDFLRNKPENLEVVMTGRDPVDELVELADYISEIKKIKHPFDKGINSRVGIEK